MVRLKNSGLYDKKERAESRLDGEEKSWNIEPYRVSGRSTVAQEANLMLGIPPKSEYDYTAAGLVR